jgi:hypothetical protein
MPLRERNSEGSSNTRWEWVYKYPTPHKEWSWPKFRREWVNEYPSQIQLGVKAIKLQGRVGAWIFNPKTWSTILKKKQEG